MYELVDDPEVGVNFLVLIIARLRGWSTVEAFRDPVPSGLHAGSGAG